MTLNLSIASLNCHGLGAGKIDFVRSLCKDNQLVLLQEHWLLTENLSTFEREISGISSHGVSAVDSTQLLQGRPHGGCSILWSTAMKCSVTPVETNNNRVCAVIVDLSSIRILITNVYLPVDTKFDRNNVSEFDDALLSVSTIARDRGIDHVIYGGDYNTDFRRHDSLHTISLRRFMRDETLIEPVNRIDYTYESMATGHRSLIDHFLISSNLIDHVTDYRVSHAVDNFSDHSPICLRLSLVAEVASRPSSASHPPQSKLNWRNAGPDSINAYKECVSDFLSHLSIPSSVIECTNPQCTEHKDFITKYCNDLIDCMYSSGMKTIPKCKPPGTRVAGWNEFVRPLRDTSLFWHTIWKQCGSPEVGWVSQIRRRTRGEYHKAVRQVKRDSESIVSDRMANSLLTGELRDLWSECKKINGSKRSSAASVDGASTDADISAVFARKYSTLYNSVSFNDGDMRQLCDDQLRRINELCCHDDCYCEHLVTVFDIRRAVVLLKSGKSDGTLVTDHLINAPATIHVHFSLLFTIMVRHGFAPRPFTDSVIVPIPKNMRKSLNNSENYRGIALNSPLSKLFELVILTRHRNILSTSDLQFGYKKGLSTNSCSFIVDEVIHEYVNGQSDVHIMLLDASKAFDCVNYITLFKRLSEKGLCPLVCRVLLQMHVIQQVRVRWNSSLSDPFAVSNGVRQGGILSPVLFSIYVDFMLNSLSDSNAGCHLGHVYCGALAYADDVILLAPSKSALERMLTTASECATKLDLKFNGTKSQYLCIGKDIHREGGVNFCGVCVPMVKEGTHLGRVISSDMTHDYVASSVRDLYARFNLVSSRFKHCSPDVKYHLFKSYCVIAYGSQIWDFQAKKVCQYFVAWRKCVRRLWGIPNTTHSDLLPGICRDAPIETQLLSRVVNFVRNCAASSNELVALSCKLCMMGTSSAVSNSIVYIAHKYSLSREFFMLRLGGIPNMNPEETAITGAIRDFAMAKLHNSAERDEIDEILKVLCTT